MNTEGLLRIHFTSEDQGRVRLATSTDWMWEVVLSLHLLQPGEPDPVFDPWRRRLAVSLSPELKAAVDFLKVIDPKASYFPDFLTPATETGDVADGINAVRCTPRVQFSVQLAELARTRALPPRVRLLAIGDKDEVAHVCRTLRTYYDAAIAPFRQLIDLRLAEVRHEYAHIAAGRGSEALLRSLGPGYDWQPPLLLTRYPFDRDLYLGGRGLLLIPSFYCVRHPVTLFDRELSPVLVLPVRRDPRWLSGSGRCAAGGETLGDLLGDTRARILELAGNDALATGAIAGKLRISAQTISYHTKILRDAGLITSNRDGASVVHHLTAMGVALLNGRPTPVGQW
ncbi:helix-turn-helix domain-containing protein [Amycolatopsis mongoliensis]|uniref:Helix-turn-helix domain-containing protein n=1 Tax=Amycolatopsis mongoliensis TaxID=715475 RepID=A0A9Y2NLI0_9PSEU|nr:helix-turn-helix domain-containing protein [Amycolatopsis sp. 4-36]WIY03843.1 helix-turn-helix domain-containing protein [Amycolatopsis sp. 4-36]